MTEQQDHEFFDLLYQQWSKTTWAKNGFWMPVPNEVHTGLFDIKAQDQDGASFKIVAWDLRKEDADFICGLHGALPDVLDHVLGYRDLGLEVPIWPM